MAKIVGMDGKEIQNAGWVERASSVYALARQLEIEHVLVIGYDAAGNLHCCSNIPDMAAKTHLLELAKHLNITEDLESFE